MITHEAFVNFSGDGQRALDIILQTLLPLGFEVESQGSTHLVVTSQAGYNSTRQDALLGITRAEFESWPLGTDCQSRAGRRAAIAALPVPDPDRPGGAGSGDLRCDVVPD